jgi:hypothetical protein
LALYLLAAAHVLRPRKNRKKEIDIVRGRGTLAPRHMGIEDKTACDTSRRRALKTFGTGAVAAAAMVGLTRTAEASEREAYGVIVYRLRTRGTKACNACKLHHRYTIFLTRAIADGNRAHVGCNCPIVFQEIPKRRFQRLFPPGSDGVAHLPRGRG